MTGSIQQITVFHGHIVNLSAGRVGGMGSAPARGDIPARVQLSITPAESESEVRILAVGAGFQLGADVWRVIEINDPGNPTWSAVLGRQE